MTATKPAASLKETGPYWDKFDRQQKAARDPAWVQAARKTAMARFAEMGFPGPQDEDWRFTNVAPVVRLPFRPALEIAADSPPLPSLAALPFASLPGSRLVFVDGHFAPALSDLAALPHGVKIGSLAAALGANPAALEPYLFRQVKTETNVFLFLNTAFFQDGLLVHVPAGTHVPEPIRAVFLATGQENGRAAHVRNLIVAEAGSKVTVLETYLSLGSAAAVTNTVTELVAADNAEVEHLKFQDEATQAFHLAALQASLGRSSNVIAHSIVTGAKLSRANIHTTLGGEGLECILNGLYLTRGDQLADHHMIVEHAQPHCASHEYFNGILADRSKGVFHGRILVRPGAQKTDAKQTNKNLLLSDDATADAKPQLEIYADDVKCTHGATVGQLNEESIFYLRSRGIGLDTARRMLIHAFAGEIIERIRHEALRTEMDRFVWDRLEQHPLVAEKH